RLFDRRGDMTFALVVPMLALVVALHSPWNSPDPWKCSPTDMPPVKRTNSVYFVAAGTANVSYPASQPTMPAQEFLVMRASDSTQLFLSGGDASLSRVRLLPLGYGPDCSRMEWLGATVWSRPGLKGFFVAAASAPSGGSHVPRHEVPLAATQPYGLAARYAPSPAAVFTLAHAMP